MVGSFRAWFLIWRLKHITRMSYNSIQRANSLSRTKGLHGTHQKPHCRCKTDQKGSGHWGDRALWASVLMSSPSWMRAELHLPDQGSANHRNPVSMGSRVSLPALGARPAHGCLKQPKVHLPLLLPGGISSGRVPVGQRHWKMAQRGWRRSGPFPQMLLITVHSSSLNQSQTPWTHTMAQVKTLSGPLRFWQHRQSKRWVLINPGT